jgi:uncharacterized protein
LKVEHWGVTATPDGSAQLKWPFRMNLRGRRVLVVDDRTDTGESMRVATEHVKTMNPQVVKTATLRHIIGGKFLPDFYGDEITWRWVVFPWNYMEDMCNIVSKIAVDGPSIDELKKRIWENHKLDMTDSEIERILDEIKRRMN